MPEISVHARLRSDPAAAAVVIQEDFARVPGDAKQSCLQFLAGAIQRRAVRWLSRIRCEIA